MPTPPDNAWQGDKIRLRTIQSDDWEAFYASDQDTEVSRLVWHIPLPRSAEGTRKWCEEMASRPITPDDDNVFLVIETLDGTVVGSMNLKECDRRNGTFGYGIGLFRKHWRKGYASEAIRLVLHHYFNELPYQKCTVNAFAFNEASIALHRHLGFADEGRMRRMHYSQGEYHDMLWFGITADEFRAR